MLTLTNITGMSSSPARNIAIEECLRTMVHSAVASSLTSNQSIPSTPSSFFLTYVNEPCVVLGRNQEAAAELSRTARETGTPRAFRRTTGGGAVYHDAGNLNWSFVVPGSLADRAGLLRLLLGALATAGVQAAVGGRGEVTVAGRKVGGTASAAGKDVLLFHGTLLVDTELSALRDSLAAHDEDYEPGSVRSVPAAVANLASFVPGLTVESLAVILSARLAGFASAAWNSLIDTQRVETLTDELSSEAWIYKRSARLGRGASMPRETKMAEMKGTT